MRTRHSYTRTRLGEICLNVGNTVRNLNQNSGCNGTMQYVVEIYKAADETPLKRQPVPQLRSPNQFQLYIAS
jgi:hypothetical protein